MESVIELLTNASIGHTIFVLALVTSIGILLGKIKIGGFSLGITWVLFAGILAGHFGLEIDPTILSYVKETGMILFIFGIGMIVGPSFFSTFKQGGIQLNLLSFLSVFISILITYIIFNISGTSIEAMVGILSGAVTNTPALGAAQETARGINSQHIGDIGIGYALGYPMAILGVIITTSCLKWVFHVKVDEESKIVENNEKAKGNEALVFSIEVTNPAIFGRKISYVKDLLDKHDFLISRIMHQENKKIEMAHSDTVITEGDRLLVIAEQNEMETICVFIGHRIEMTDALWGKLDHRLISRKCLVTKGRINGKSIEELKLRNIYNVNISRVQRAGVHLIGKPDLHLQTGDTVILVGEEENVKRVEKMLGNSANSLRIPNLLVLFVVILLGVLIGSIAVPIAGMSTGVKLGFSGGTLVVAILISNFGTRFKLDTHNTQSVNLMIKEFGITLFLACVGLSVGGDFFEKLINGGYVWMGYAIVITVIPIWITTIIGRYWLKLDYFTLLGYIAGALTFAPALSLTPDASKNNIPAIRYATVYPITLFVRVMIAQWMILLFS